VGRGRPTDYTEKLADEICNVISVSPKGLPTLCKENPHWPAPTTIFAWRAKYEDFSNKYTKAKHDQIESLVDDMLEISKDDSKDYLTDKEGNTVGNAVRVSRSRLQIETNKWLAMKLLPRVYGDSLLSKNPEAQSLIEKILDKL
jgi:hypothetical protein